VFLGVTAVVPRSDVKRHFEDLVAGPTIELDKSLQSALTQLFTLPPLSSRDSPLDDDRVLDVIVTHHQAGGVEVLEWDWVPIPFGWRPKVAVTARLSNVATNVPINTYTVTEKQPWLPYLEFEMPDLDIKHLFSVPAFDNEILNQLLYRACNKLLRRMKKDLK